MADINIEKIDDWLFEVRVVENGGGTIHEVTMDEEDFKRLGGGKSPEELLRKSFEFLLARESKESILRKFDLMDIAKYFREFEEEIK